MYFTHVSFLSLPLNISLFLSLVLSFLFHFSLPPSLRPSVRPSISPASSRHSQPVEDYSLKEGSNTTRSTNTLPPWPPWPLQLPPQPSLLTLTLPFSSVSSTVYNNADVLICSFYVLIHLVVLSRHIITKSHVEQSRLTSNLNFFHNNTFML